jgi:hypothetical protein
MGCDFYITKVLQIYYNDNEYLEYELEKKKANYCYDLYDEDEENYEEMMYSSRRKHRRLDPQEIPIETPLSRKLREEKERKKALKLKGAAYTAQ